MKQNWKSVAVVLFCAAAVSYVLWVTSGFVMAFREERRAHIFPTAVYTVGWDGGENALTQDLSSEAPYASFSQGNSAYVFITPPTSSNGGTGGGVDNSAPSPGSDVSTPNESTSNDTPPSVPTSEPVPESTIPNDTGPPTDAAEVTPGSEAPVESGAGISTPPAPETPQQDAASPPVPAEVPPNPVAEPAPTSLLNRVAPLVIDHINTYGAFLLSYVATVVFATTSDDLSHTTIAADHDTSLESVATCTVLGTTCHTIEFKDFIINGSVLDKEFQKAELNFSFAHIARETGTLDGRLEVRYFHDGRWRSAGEIYLNKEFSNAANGAYFTQELDGITSWTDLSDVKVAFEYEPGNGNVPVQLYLDAVWLDAVYMDPVQDLLSGKVDDPVDAPQNVSFDLTKGEKDENTLILENGSKLFFPYLDTLSGNTFIVRADKAAYIAPQTGSSTVVYTSITNTKKKSDTFKLFISFPGGKGEVTDISQYLRNVPSAATTSQTSDLTYFCEGGWQNASTSGQYACASTHETYQCVSVSEPGTNCLVSQVAIGVSTTTSYTSAWVPIAFNSTDNSDRKVEKELPRGYSIAYAGDKTIEILPGQTVYFKITLATPDTDNVRFVLSAKGDKYFGDLDSMHLRDETYLRAQEKVKKESKQQSRLNEQLSERSDFNVDELPQFHFKFKTQRSFFTRVKDALTRKTVPYEVKSAQLRHSSGEVEHVPVDIEYGVNDEWTLKLEKVQRAFRPGKYSIDLAMDEGNNAYVDTIEFYWGVLAMNPEKSSYESGEIAHLSIAALDDSGNTMCDAQLALSITDPSGNTTDVPVVSGGGCGANNITTLPDFVADYEVQEEGEYSLLLSRLDDAGDIVTSITDALTVDESASYVVTRDGPTRIFPQSAYTMRMTIDAPQGFTGSIVETLPEGFTVGETNGAVLTRADGVIYLTWDTSVVGGTPKEISYKFKAPEVSPYMYSLGPLALKDSTAVVFKEGRTWKIASDATSIATGVAWLTGNATASSTNLNDTTSYAMTWNLTDDYDTTYFTHSTTSNNSQLTVNVAGDYLVALTIPIERADTSGNRTSIEAEIRVNGAKKNIGVSRAFIRTNGTANESSNHLYVLLKGLSANDYIESFVHGLSTSRDSITIGTQASLYAEYIGNDQSVYFGIGTTTTGGTNLNPTSTSTIAWYDDSTLGRSDANYSHNNTSASTTITLASAGSYMVFVNIPLSGAVTNAKPLGRISLNGVIATGTEFKQGYIANNSSVTDSSMHFSGIVTATTSNVSLSVTVLDDGAAGTLTVNNDAASIYIQKLPSTGIYFGTATTTAGGTNWNQTPATSSLWRTDYIKDTGVYTHATSSNSHQITVLQAGDYLLALNDNHAGAVNGSNEITSISVNGVARTGAQTKTHFSAANGMGNSTSGSLVYLLRDLAINDVVTVTTVLEGAAGTILEDRPAHLMLWHKSAQSSFIQNSERWYANLNGEPPTDAWPSGSVNLDQGDQITTGTSVKSGDVLRLRMGLTANASTIAGADSFKLQYAVGTECSLALTWLDVGTVGSTSVWRGYDNASVAAGATLSSTTLAASTIKQTYEEGSPSAVTPNAITAGSDAEWDWVLENNSAPVGTSYCFRMVQSTGQVLKDYLDYPLLITNNAPGTPELDTMFDNEKTASTSPFFTFSASDDNGEDVHYQIQVSADPAFGSTVIDEDSVTYFSKFTNTVNTADKAPFASDQLIRYVPTVSLTSDTTYWWRVRAKDTAGSNTWGSYSSARSFTVDTSVTVSTWYQTTSDQFNTGTLSQVAATSTNDVRLSAGFTSGTIYSPAVEYDSHTTGNSWGIASTSLTLTGGQILYYIEYYTSTSSWAVIPDSALPGNSAGTSTNAISLTQLDPSTYSTIRIRADFTQTSASPRLADWTISWALSVAAPTLSTLFDNEKTASTSPSFYFTTTDPQSDRLVYQLQWSTDSTFATGVSTSTSDTNAGFYNVSSTTDVSPFQSGDTIRYATTTTPFVNGSTYWWRVRAKDPSGGNAYSLWSDSRSFTVDTSVLSSTWFQTTAAQFNTDTLTLTGASGGSVTATSTTGQIAVYRHTTATEALTSTTTFNNGWDTTIRQDPIYGLNGTTSLILDIGHYAVMYNSRFNVKSGTNRAEIQTNLNLAGTNLPIGWSHGFIRGATGAVEGFNSGGGIIYVSTDDSTLKLQSIRTDANTSLLVHRTGNTSGIQLIKLDEAWSYLRLSKTGKQTGPISSTWMPVTYDRQDEIDTTDFGHTTGGSSITLKTAGHYLVFANTYGSLPTGSTVETVVDQKLKLDNSDIEGSFTTVYMRGNTNSNAIYQGAASIGMIIESTTTNQVLTVQVARSAGTAAWTINGTPTGPYVNRTGITIVKLPEADFIRLQHTINTASMNPSLLTALNWNTDSEKDSSFTHSTVALSNRIIANTTGDYLLMGALYAAPGTLTVLEPSQGWRKNGGTLLQYGQTGNFNPLTTSNVGNWSANIFPTNVNGDYFEMVVQAMGSTTNAASSTKKGLQGVRIASLSEADTNPKTVVSSDIVFANGTGPKWSTFSWSDTRPALTSINYKLYYLSATSTYSLVPDVDLPGNSTGFTTTDSSVSIANLNRLTYTTLRTQATFTCAGGGCPTLDDWTVSWSQGINISGTAKQFDQIASSTYGTVGVAVNGTLQSGKTGTISNGSWTISNVTAFTGDIITVFVSTTTSATKAVAVTEYTGTNDITGMSLYQNHLTLGSDDNPTLTNADIALYDNSVSGNAAIINDVTASNLVVCSVPGCADARLLIKSGTIYQPGGNVTTPNIQIDGSFIAEANTVSVSRSWKNNAVFNKGTSSVIFTATSTSETIDSSNGTTTSSIFYAVTFGQTSGSATWTLQSPLAASSTLSLNFGNLLNGTNTLMLSGDLSIGASGVYRHGAGSTTFSGTGSNTWTDSNSTKQDMGDVIIDGVSKTVTLGSNVKATNITIGSNDTLDASGSSYGITVNGNWTNNNSFSAQSGTVTFAATTTGKSIAAGSSGFYNATFNGVGGNWAFSGDTVTIGNNFTISTGTVTLPTGTTTVVGSFDSSTGTFLHNNGAVLLTSASSKTITPGASSFYDLVFNGSGSWSFGGANATTSRNVVITAGSVTLPSNTLAIGGAFTKNGGSFTHNSGTLKFTASTNQNIRLNSSSAYNLLFAGTATWSFVDTSATVLNNYTIQTGTTTLPSGTLTVGGSFINSGGVFSHNNGTVLFNAGSTGFSISPSTSPFYDLTLNSSSGGWTVTANATTTHDFTVSNASSITLASSTVFSVGGTFTNSVGGSATAFGSSTIALKSGTSYSLNSKSAGGDTYGKLDLAASTHIRMWNSSAINTTVHSSGSLYSQNHAAVSGALYIYGDFLSGSSEYWAANTDFDGTALTGGNRRAVQVQIASSSSITITGGTFSILGTSTATTTITSIGVGAYSFSITGGTLNAQYYSISSTSVAGLSISGTPTITSLSNGDFALTVPSGGTSLTIASTVIDQNPLLQIQQVRFATSSGVTSGYNVTESGTPSSYWWFRNHYGNYDGEDYNNDPGGNPGYIRWDDSGYNITVSGHVYANHGSPAIGNPPCDGSAVVKIVVGTNAYTGSCNAGNGSYNISEVQFTGEAVLTAFLDTNGGKTAVTVTKTPTADISDFDLYQDTLIVRQEGVVATTISDLALYDNSDDTDIFFAAATGSPDTLTVQPEKELYIWTGSTFAPGGNITLQSGGSGDVRDGRLFIATSSTFTAAGTESHAIGGGLFAQSGSTFTAANSTITFTATTTNKTIYSAQALTFYNLTFNGSGGGWLVVSTSSPTTISHAFVLSAGTLGGTGDITVQAGNVTGSGTIAMTGGTFLISSTGNFGSSNAWQFNNLTFGDGVSANVTTNTSTATTTVTGVLTVATNQTLSAGFSGWALTGGGTPFVISGTFNVQGAPVAYSSASATTIANTNYGQLILAPSAAGSPTYTLSGGTPTIGNLMIGDGTYPVTVTANTNDPSVSLAGTMTIRAGSTYIASNIGALNVGHSWLNSGTFTHSSAGVTFNATTTGNSISPSTSPFYDLTLNSSSGGWTVTANATTTHDFTVSNASSITLASSTVFSVGGTFTNSVGGSATAFGSSTIALKSGTSYSLNSKSAGGDTYGKLDLAASTHIRMWNSSAINTTVHSSGSLYSQNHAAVSGALYVWGAYTRSTGSDYWSYANDFDGTALGGSSRQVTVYIATSSTITLSGGVLDIIGSALASTTIQNQGTGAYAFSVTGGTLNAQYYQIRNTDASGLNISGTPTITSLSNGDFELSRSGATTLTVAGTVIDANPLKIVRTVKFATTTNISGYNVVATGSSASSWKFNLHYGNLAGEAFDNDPTGDPGYLRWDDSASQITISGHVYSDEGSTVSPVCDDATHVVKLVIEGTTVYDALCNSLDGEYSISGISFNPGDTLTLYLDTSGGRRAANISVDPITNITNMDLYENRVILRHEDTTPITIANIAQYDSSGDSDIPFTTTTGGTDTLTLRPNTKLIIWDGKTFAPAGNITIQSGGDANSYDGSVEVKTNATFSAASTQSHSIGGSLIFDSGTTLVGASATFTFTATTTGKTVTPPASSSFYNMTFNGVGGNWAFSANATTTNDFTITNGTVTLPTGYLSVGGSLNNSGGAFLHNNGTVTLTATASGKDIRVGTSSLYNLVANGSGGGWTFYDANATTSNNFTITNGSVTLPSGVLAVGNSFINAGTFTHNSGTVKFTATASGKNVQAGGSSFSKLLFNGVGGTWTFLDTNATTTSDVTITNGTTTLPAGTFEVGGSFINNAAFSNSNGTVKLTATATGKNITASTSPFYSLVINSSSGGWTVTGNATTTHDFTLTNASSFAIASSTTFSVGGTFTNLVGGSATSFGSSTIALVSGTSYTINTKSAGGDVYGRLDLAASTNIRMWSSSSINTVINSSASLYSQNHGAVSGALYIYGTYARSSGSDYWSYATDFDGTAGSSRQVNVYIATSSSVTISGSGSLNIVGTASASTTIQNQGVGAYTFAVSGGTLNAQYYQVRNTDANGLNITGTPTISSLSYGDFLLNGSSTMITVAGTVIDANASLHISGVKFATSSGVIGGTNVKRTGSPVNAWTFQTHYGNYAGEAYDNDGADACGYIRWSDSSCLFISQSHFRWRNDDGGEGALSTEWYNASWTYRKKIAITNPNATTYTDLPVKIVVDYDSNMKSDFGDLRFTDSSGTVLIPYVIESKVDSASTTVWVKVPSLPASDAATIYMYYGNGGVYDASDGANTFTYFDSFESGSLSGYSGNTSTKFNVSTNFAHSGTYGLDAGTHVGEFTNPGMYKTGSQTAQGQTIRYFQYVDSSQQDEPCTFFGVQGSGSNYAICLDEYPVSRVEIAKNITSNDGSGTVLASTTVTYSTGWYEVIIDWLTDNSINVTVYDANGDVFATVNKTDSSYTSGGVGFSYWGQNGGWDFYTSRQYTASAPTTVFGVRQESNGATWAADEDSALDALAIGSNIRLRFSVQNTGSELTDKNFRLQVAPIGNALNCESVSYVSYNDVPTTAGGCGSSVACMTTSSQFTNLASTSGSLTYPASMSFDAGYILENPSNQTNAMSISSNAATEVEYNFQLTSNATANNYCFRTSEGGIDLDNYEHVARVTVLHAPSISNISFNSATDISLTEGTTTVVVASSTVTDLNGYSDILFATSTMYRSAVGPSCSVDDNSCYQIASTSCALSSCSGNACTLTCSARFQYIADPTDTDSTYEAQNWLAALSVEDSSGLRDTQTSAGVDVFTLYGLALNTASIDFGTLTPGSNTGVVNSTTTVLNTGNSVLNIQLLGTNLEGVSNYIDVGQQKYSTSTFEYGSCAICQVLTGSATDFDINLAKPVSTTTPSTKDLYWGIDIPEGTGADSYEGTNTFIATGG